MSGEMTVWPKLSADVQVARSRIRRQSAQQAAQTHRPSPSSHESHPDLTPAPNSGSADELVTRVDRLSTYVEQLTEKVASRESEPQVVSIHGRDYIPADAIIDLRKEHAVLEARLENEVAEARRARAEQVRDVADARELARESRQIAEKSAYKAEAAVGNSEALQADFDQAREETDIRLAAIEEGIDRVVAETEIVRQETYQTGAGLARSAQESRSQIEHLEMTVRERHRSHTQANASFQQRLERLDARLQRIEEIDEEAPPEEELSPRPLTSWQIERRQTRRR